MKGGLFSFKQKAPLGVTHLGLGPEPMHFRLWWAISTTSWPSNDVRVDWKDKTMLLAFQEAHPISPILSPGFRWHPKTPRDLDSRSSWTKSKDLSCSFRGGHFQTKIHSLLLSHPFLYPFARPTRRRAQRCRSPCRRDVEKNYLRPCRSAPPNLCQTHVYQKHEQKKDPHVLGNQKQTSRL